MPGVAHAQGFEIVHALSWPFVAAPCALLNIVLWVLAWRGQKRGQKIGKRGSVVIQALSLLSVCIAAATCVWLQVMDGFLMDQISMMSVFFFGVAAALGVLAFRMARRR